VWVVILRGGEIEVGGGPGEAGRACQLARISLLMKRSCTRPRQGGLQQADHLPANVSHMVP